ncbi:MAG: tRNA (adenosine(37)-N6)-dimethylallyltransferase MiaA [Burkholderiaceae bacterium]
MTPPLALLLGPTASGKSALAMALAERFPIEIVSVDSAQVYRGMDIGTAKPDAVERAAVRHHLIDVVDPADAYSAARFAEDARAVIDDIRRRGRVPLLCGGTMLYVRALLGGFDALPSADAATRERLNARAARVGWPGMHAWLADVDPVTAARLAPNDSQRIQRALEVFTLTGQPMSALLARHREDAPASPLADARIVSLEPAARAMLHERIAARFDAMLARGLIDEVRTLRQREDLHPGLPSIRCVGYRQVWSYLDGDIDRAAMREQGIAATRQLAKRQLTWLRAMPTRRVIDPLERDPLAAAIDALAPALEPAGA